MSTQSTKMEPTDERTIAALREDVLRIHRRMVGVGCVSAAIIVIVCAAHVRFGPFIWGKYLLAGWIIVLLLLAVSRRAEWTYARMQGRELRKRLMALSAYEVSEVLPPILTEDDYHAHQFARELLGASPSSGALAPACSPDGDVKQASLIPRRLREGGKSIPTTLSRWEFEAYILRSTPPELDAVMLRILNGVRSGAYGSKALQEQWSGMPPTNEAELAPVRTFLEAHVRRRERQLAWRGLGGWPRRDPDDLFEGCPIAGAVRKLRKRLGTREAVPSEPPGGRGSECMPS